MYSTKFKYFFKISGIALSFIFMCCFLVGCYIIGSTKSPDGPQPNFKPSVGIFFGRIDKIYNSSGDINVDSIKVRVHWGVPNQDEIIRFNCVRKKAENGYWYFIENWFDEDKYHGSKNDNILNNGKYYEFHFKNHDDSSIRYNPPHNEIIVIHWELSL